jgi:hypothetical protein
MLAQAHDSYSVESLAGALTMLLDGELVPT